MWWRPQQASRGGVRIDDGIREGATVSPFYDPMVAKIIVHGRDRDDAIRRMRAALQDAPLLGLKNNGRFLSDLVDHAAFRNAQMTTTMIDSWQEQGEPLLQAPVATESVWYLAAMLFALHEGAGWRPDSVAAFGFSLKLGEASRKLHVRADRLGGVGVTLDGVTEQVQRLSWADGMVRFVLHGVQQTAVAVIRRGVLHLSWKGCNWQFEEVSAFPSADALQDASRARSPVAGKVTQVLVQAGDQVQEGQQLVCVEAMKMEMWLCAQSAGTVKAVHAETGHQVESQALLVELELTPQSKNESK